MEKKESPASELPPSQNFDSTLETQRAGKETSLDHSPAPIDEKYEYVTGYKLFVVIGASTVAGFLMLLDTSIVATVSQESHSLTIFVPTDSDRRFLESPAISILSRILDGMGLPTN